jgi:hypothetical protein
MKLNLNAIEGERPPYRSLFYPGLAVGIGVAAFLAFVGILPVDEMWVSRDMQVILIDIYVFFSVFDYVFLRRRRWTGAAAGLILTIVTAGVVYIS